MLDFKEVEIGDKAVFEKYTRGYSNVEACFGNIFLWRENMLWKQGEVLSGTIRDIGKKGVRRMYQ